MDKPQPFTEDEYEQIARYIPIAMTVDKKHFDRALATIAQLRSELHDVKRELSTFHALQEAAREKYDEEHPR